MKFEEMGYICHLTKIYILIHKIIVLIGITLIFMLYIYSVCTYNIGNTVFSYLLSAHGGVVGE